jgi:hypothetical protein
MIIIKLFASFNRNLKYETYEALFELKEDEDYYFISNIYTK